MNMKRLISLIIVALMIVAIYPIVTAGADDTHVYISYYDISGDELIGAEIGDTIYAHIVVNTTQEIDTWQYQWINFTQGKWNCSKVTIGTYFASTSTSNIGTILNASGQVGDGTFFDSTSEVCGAGNQANNSNLTTANLTMDLIGVGVVNITFEYVSGGNTPFRRGGIEVQYTFHDDNLTIYPQYPQSFSATANGQTQIDLAWTKGSAADRTMIRGKLGSSPTSRTDGTLIYNNTGSATSDTVGPGEHWYYKAWSWNTTETMFSYNNATDDATSFENNPPVFGTPSPLNGSSGNNLTFNWQIPITDPDGDTFNWTIECNNSQNSSANGASNGTKSLSLTGLANNVTYTVWVNATDGTYTRKWFTFTTLVAGSPNPPPSFTATADGRFEIDLTWNPPLGDETDKVYIEWNTTDGWGIGEGTELYNGTGSSTTHTGLPQNTIRYYQAWGWNESGGTYSSTFNSDNDTTDSNIAPNYGTPSPTNGSSGQSLSLTWGIAIQDAEGDTFNWSIECNNSQSNSSNTEGNGTKNVSLSGLSYSTEYTVWVNTTDSYNWTREWFTFTTEAAASNTQPYQPADPDPENNEPDVPINLGEFSCLVSDPDGDTLDCSAYWSNHTLIDTNNSVANNTIVHFDVGNLEKDTTYYWYVNVSDGEFTVQSTVWNFTTMINRAPDIPLPLPLDNDTSVSAALGQLKALVADSDGDACNVSFYWGNDTLIGSVVSVTNGTYASISIPTLIAGQAYLWYVNITDTEGEWTRGPTSGNWTFTVTSNGGGGGGGGGGGDDDDDDAGGPPTIGGVEINYAMVIVVAVIAVIGIAVAIILYRKK